MNRSGPDIDTTPPFDFIYGRYRLSEWEIPYLTTSITFRDAARSLFLTSEIPGGDNIDWSLSELYQRDINWKRVEDQIVPYLKSIEKPQFFNSITVALLPFQRKNSHIVDSFSDGSLWTAPKLSSEQNFKKELEIGPIRLGFWDDWDDLNDPNIQIGKMVWNKDEVFPVAIDGQHRLAAIKELVETSATDDDVIKSRIPIIFVLFDDRLGYRNPSSPEPIVNILRRLFIDLNKHALTVKRGRQILLDDQDPTARCVRALISERLENDVNSITSSPRRLPLSLVDWHSEQAKFDEGPYLTTVLGLDWTVLKTIGIKPISDWTDYTALETQIDRIERALEITLGDARIRLAQARDYAQAPFTYSDEDLDQIVHAFTTMWADPIVSLLTMVRPYHQLIYRRNTDRSFTVDFQQWYKLFSEKGLGKHSSDTYQSFLRRMLTDEVPQREVDYTSKLDKISIIKGESGDLEFSVIMQKSLLFALLEFAKITEPDIQGLLDWSESQVEPPDWGGVADPDFGFEPGPDTAANTQSVTASEISPLYSSQFRSQAERYLKRSSEFTLAVNSVVDGWDGFLHTGASFESASDRVDYLWQSSLRKPEGGIDFSEGAAKRAGDLIFLIASLYLYRAAVSDSGDLEFTDVWTDLTDNAGPSILRRTARAIQRLAAEGGIGGRIVKLNSDRYSEQPARDEIFARLEAVWAALGD